MKTTKAREKKHAKSVRNYEKKAEAEESLR
jgi:hypothetical protein